MEYQREFTETGAEMVSVAEASHRLGLSLAHLYRLIAAGEFTTLPTRQGRQMMLVSDIEARTARTMTGSVAQTSR